eukprot:Skav213752  [mRNA]  locus=scaffold258:200100:205715:+ [translate_table: standard]
MGLFVMASLQWMLLSNPVASLRDGLKSESLTLDARGPSNPRYKTTRPGASRTFTKGPSNPRYKTTRPGARNTFTKGKECVQPTETRKTRELLK